MLNIIGIAAPSHGCGKSTFADLIKTRVSSRYNSRSGFDRIGDYDIFPEIIPFAMVLKEMIGVLLNENIKLYSLDKEEPNPKLSDKSLRYVMQSLGAFMRSTISEDVWIEAWKRRVNALKFSSKNILVVVDDLRYENEYNALKEMGATFVFVYRKPLSEDNHESEGNITKAMCDYIISNTKNFEDYDEETHDEDEGYVKFVETQFNNIDKIMTRFEWDETYTPMPGWRW